MSCVARYIIPKTKDYGENKLKFVIQNKSEHSVDVVIREFGIRM